MVVDGLDEASPERSLSLLLPQPLPEGLLVIVSVRANETEKLDNLPTQLTQKLHLNPLLSPTIADWLRRAGNGELLSLAQDETFVAQVCDRTEGIPLFLNYLIDELVEVAQQGEESAIRKTLEATPKGFAKYIRQQYQALDRLEDWRSRPELRKIFYFLTIAKGELSSDDFVELMGESPVGLPWRVSRWFKIRHLEECLVFSFAHSTLAEQFAILPEIKANTKKSQKELIKYCADWQERHSAYALRHYAEHLSEAKQWDELYAIARNEDFALTQQKHLLDEPDLPLKTVQAALLGAAEKDDAAAIAEFLLVHARRLVLIAKQESPLDALRSGSLERAWKLADNIYEIERCVLWYLLLAWELKDTNKQPEARATLERLQQKELPRCFTQAATEWQGDYAAYLLAYAFEISEQAYTALHQQLLDNYYRRLLCRILQGRGYFRAACETAQALSSELDQVFELASIAKEQAEKGEKQAARTTLAKTLQMIRKFIRRSFYHPAWVMEMARIAKFLIEELEDKKAALNVFANAFETAKKIGNQQQRVATFIAIADMQAEAKMFSEAINTLQKIDCQSTLEDSLRAIANVQAKLGQIEKARHTFASAKQNARCSEDKNKQFDALVKIVAAQAEVKEFINDALETAIEIDSQWQQSQALRSLVIAQVKAEDFLAALTTACRIKESTSRAEALSMIAKAQAEAKDFTAALRTVAEIDSQWQQAQALVVVVEAQAWANPFSDDAIEIAVQIKSQRELTQALVIIVTAQAEAGAFLAALTTKSKIEDKNGQQNALSAIAKAYARAKNYDAAFEIIETINDSRTLVKTLGAIAKIQAEASQLPAARATFATALQMAQGTETAFQQALALVDVAKLQVKIEQKEAGISTASIAHQLAERIDNLREKATVLGLVAEVVAKAGNRAEAKAIFDSAIEIAQKINIQQERVSIFTVIAQARTRIEDFAAALQTAQKIEWPWIKAEVLGAIAKAQAAAGQWEESQETFSIALETPGFFEEEVQVNVLCTRAVVEAARDKVAALETFRKLLEFAQESGKQRDNYLSTIAAAQAEAGEIPTALKITDEIEDGRERVKALLAIAWEQFNKGEKEILPTTLAKAFQAKDKIEDEQKRLQALREIAGIQAMAGKGNEAVRTVEAILTDRNWHLPGIASWFVKTGDQANFKRLLIPCAYNLDAAYDMCGYLAQLYPEKAEEIAKVVSDLN
jgi:hypothetical protein